MAHAADPPSLSSTVYDDALDWEIPMIGDDSEKFGGEKLDHADETIRRTSQDG